ncbi:MAG TPA: hypothetical protein PK514_15270 [Spirochaetota bacterium]|nr:hypothetical protein [Spirochaetota bacterium]
MNTRQKSMLFIRPLCFIILMYIPVLAGEPDFISATALKETFIINEVSGPPDTSSDALVSYIDYRTINSRAKSMRQTTVDDAAPYIDNIAFFLVQPRIECPVNGLEKGKNYTIFIDFVRYRGKRIPFDGTLKIFIKDAYGNEQLIGTVDSSIFYSDKIFSAEIPFNLSYSGSFAIIIHEYSMKTGNWGIWDIIVTSKRFDEIGEIKSETTPQLKDSGTKIFD